MTALYLSECYWLYICTISCSFALLFQIKMASRFWCLDSIFDQIAETKVNSK